MVKKLFGKYMKRLFLFFFLVLIFNICQSQKYNFCYEMSFQELETGYYYIEYESNKHTDSVRLQIYVKDHYNNAVSRDVKVIQNLDSVKLRPDESGLFYYNINYEYSTLCILINNEGTRWTNFYKCIHFWDWNELRAPTKLVIVLGEKEPGVIHIRSNKPLNASDFQEVKNKYLRKPYNRDAIDYLQTRRLIYY